MLGFSYLYKHEHLRREDKGMKAITQEVANCKSHNGLNHEHQNKRYILFYGYKYEDPSQLYAIDYDDYRYGERLAIKKLVKDNDVFKSTTYKSATNTKNEPSMQDVASHSDF